MIKTLFFLVGLFITLPLAEAASIKKTTMWCASPDEMKRSLVGFDKTTTGKTGPNKSVDAEIWTNSRGDFAILSAVAKENLMCMVFVGGDFKTINQGEPV